MLDYCHNIIPSSVVRLGFNGRVFYTKVSIITPMKRFSVGCPGTRIAQFFITFQKVNQTDRSELMSEIYETNS